MGGGEQYKGAVGGGGVAVEFGFGVEGVAGDDYGGEVGGGAALAGYAAGAGTVETEEGGEGFGCVLFYYCQGWGDLVDVDLGGGGVRNGWMMGEMRGRQLTFVLRTARTSSEMTPTCVTELDD